MAANVYRMLAQGMSKNFKAPRHALADGTRDDLSVLTLTRMCPASLRAEWGMAPDLAGTFALAIIRSFFFARLTARSAKPWCDQRKHIAPP